MEKKISDSVVVVQHESDIEQLQRFLFAGFKSFHVTTQSPTNEIPCAAADMTSFFTFPLLHVSKHLGWRHWRNFVQNNIATCSKQKHQSISSP